MSALPYEYILKRCRRWQVLLDQTGSADAGILRTRFVIDLPVESLVIVCAHFLPIIHCECLEIGSRFSYERIIS
jgi:hypothetical protein